ncbi:MAG: CehA/McbA family metallohydrolase [Flammeovirgaceae bacterium]|nr:CehA/McbA family metallohydrolase [Flammeovirgaceae bacterium]
MSNGKSFAPDDVCIHGNEAFDRKLQPFESYYFHSSGKVEVDVPVGQMTLSASHGFEHEIITLNKNIESPETIDLVLESIDPPADWGTWVNADLHVHMNYGGHYRNTPERLSAMAKSEDLDVVYNLVVNKEQRIPDIDYFSSKPDNASDDEVLIVHGQEYHTSYWGHLGLIGLTNYFLPGYTFYSKTAMASAFPSNAVIADMTHDQKGLVGYVHPFDTELDLTKPTGYSLPVDVALGKVDYYEAMGYSDHHITTKVWYRFMNCGFRLTPVGGTDAMPNFASLRGPVGLTRAFIKIDERDKTSLQEKLLSAIKKEEHSPAMVLFWD